MLLYKLNTINNPPPSESGTNRFKDRSILFLFVLTIYSLFPHCCWKLQIQTPAAAAAAAANKTSCCYVVLETRNSRCWWSAKRNASLFTSAIIISERENFLANMQKSAVFVCLKTHPAAIVQSCGDNRWAKLVVCDYWESDLVLREREVVANFVSNHFLVMVKRRCVLWSELGR